jgi:hypothetical protein
MDRQAALEELLQLEKSFWTEAAAFFRANMRADALLVFPPPVGVMTAEQSVEATANSARWESVDFHDERHIWLHDDAVLFVYQAEARRAGASASYRPIVSSVYVRAGSNEQWRLAFHQQSS